jgi:hypothetical protein
MAEGDLADTGAAAGAPAKPDNKLVTGGVGALIGAASTLLGTQIANLGVKQLLNDNAYIGLAVFSLLAALVVVVVGLSIRRADKGLTPILASAGVLVAAAVAFTGFSTLPPQMLPIHLQPIPDMAEVPTIQVVGSRQVGGSSLGGLDWKKGYDYAVVRSEAINLNVQPMKDYYNQQLASCVKTVADASTGAVKVNLGTAAY